MDDTKASAAHHPFDPPSQEVLEQARAAGLNRGNSFSYDNTVAAEQAEAEAGESAHDAETSRTDADVLEELRGMYSFEAIADAAQKYTTDESAAAYEQWRFGRTRELLGYMPITQEQFFQIVEQQRAADEAARGPRPGPVDRDRAARRAEAQQQRRLAKREGKKK